MNEELLKVENLTKHFSAKEGIFGRGGGVVHAVNGVSFSIKTGETFGLVGESGCGKSTLAKLIARLIEPTSGKVIFDGRDITNLKQSRLKDIRKNIQFIFQDPHASLNPRMTIGETIGEPLLIHKIAAGKENIQKVLQLLNVVGLDKDALSRYPHEFSTGQRQRIGIARAIALNPKLIIADEPISSLDVSVQAQILNLLEVLRKEFNLTYLFITHDLRIVEYISDRVMVMYLGKIMEISNCADIYKQPLHPYTEALLSSTPIPDPRKKKQRILLRGEIPSPLNLPSGCVFHTRCIYAKEKCSVEVPSLISKGERLFACHYPLL
ncbi:MAG: dipeptide ABC transporter ATP-binding protein [Candidatus Omnitrophota bacterium]|nr:dipeptide ABC transporter ATP-binding protein [Candidatus Omnitrophota bacterium]